MCGFISLTISPSIKLTKIPLHGSSVSIYADRAFWPLSSPLPVSVGISRRYHDILMTTTLVRCHTRNKTLLGTCWYFYPSTLPWFTGWFHCGLDYFPRFRVYICDTHVRTTLYAKQNTCGAQEKASNGNLIPKRLGGPSHAPNPRQVIGDLTWRRGISAQVLSHLKGRK